jgi:hypothetical protein
MNCGLRITATDVAQCPCQKNTNRSLTWSSATVIRSSHQRVISSVCRERWLSNLMRFSGVGLPLAENGSRPRRGMGVAAAPGSGRRGVSSAADSVAS